MVHTINIPAEYPYILAGLSAHFILFTMLMPVVGLVGRKTAFGEEFMSQF